MIHQLVRLLTIFIDLLEAEPGQVEKLEENRLAIQELTDQVALDAAEIERLKAEGNPLNDAEVKPLLDKVLILLGAADPPTPEAVAKTEKALDFEPSGLGKSRSPQTGTPGAGAGQPKVGRRDPGIHGA